MRPRFALALLVMVGAGCAEQPIEPTAVIVPKGRSSLLGSSSPALMSSLDPAAAFTYLSLPFDAVFAINDAGLAVGASSSRAAIWTASGGFVELGNIDGSGTCCSYFKGVNATGMAVGADDDGVQFWTQSTNSRTQLGEGVGFAINDNGDVAGHNAGLFYIPSGGTRTQLQLGSFFIHGYIGEGRAINNSRSIVGYLWGPDGLTHAVVWPDPASPVIDLGSLGGDQAQANSIDNAGDIVGWGEVAHGSVVRHAVLWPATGGMVDLTTWPNPCMGTSEANGANDQGIIVGTCDGQPVLWTAVQGMRLLSLPTGPGNSQRPFAINSHLQIGGTGGLWEPQATQTINFGALSARTFGDPDFTVGATASSGLTVSFSATGSCTVSGTTVHLTGAGSCTITAEQAGNSIYPAAPSVPQSFRIAQGFQTITFTSSPPNNAVEGGPTYLVTAAGGGSGNPVTFATLSTGVCTVSGSTVSFVGFGACTLTANQAGNTNYAAASAATQSAAVADAAPVVTAIVLPSDPIAVQGLVTITASFADAGRNEVHPAAINWGDGTTSVGVVSESSGAGTVSGQHTYSGAGVYTVRMTVSDGQLSGQRSSTLDNPSFIVVYDPSAGFVTGGGWIDSPAGACLWSGCNSDGSSIGRATFGFVSRYEKGATIPTGNTEFQFQAGGLHFTSSSYQWLVVAGTKAQYKGTGTINGDGTYGFLITVIDGDLKAKGNPDQFRVKIWNAASGAIIYDNQLGQTDDSSAATAIGGGSIVIHN